MKSSTPPPNGTIRLRPRLLQVWFSIILGIVALLSVIYGAITFFGTIQFNRELSNSLQHRGRLDRELTIRCSELVSSKMSETERQLTLIRRRMDRQDLILNELYQAKFNRPPPELPTGG